MLSTLLGTRVYYQIPIIDDVGTHKELQPYIFNSGSGWVHTFRPLSVIKILKSHGVKIVNPNTSAVIDYESLNGVTKVFLLQMQLTVDGFTLNGFAPENNLAKAAFDKLYQQYALPGVQALYDAGYDTPTKVADFWMECYQSVGELAQKLKLE